MKRKSAPAPHPIPSFLKTIGEVIAEAEHLPEKQRAVAAEFARWLKEVVAGNYPVGSLSQRTRKQKFPEYMRDEALLYIAYSLGVATSRLHKQFINDWAASGRAARLAQPDFLGQAIDGRLKKFFVDNEGRRAGLPFTANEIAHHILNDVNKELKTVMRKPVRHDTVRRRLRRVKTTSGNGSFEVIKKRAGVV